MQVILTERDDTTIFTIAGSVDSLNADQLSATFAPPIAQGRVRLVADFSSVNYTSSAGLRSLLGAVKESRRGGGDLRIAGLQPQVERVLAIAGFTSIIKVFPDVEAAVASYRA